MPIEGGNRRPRLWLAERFGITAGTRQTVIQQLFSRSRDEITAYWLQLALSIGIATLGLVMGSGAVIIGAMLVAPLMGPIVELALSLLVGAGSVMLGAAGRVLLSVLLAVSASAVLTSMLPFNEPSAEILARVAPTVLDLFVAMCCAVAAAFVTARPSNGGSSTAAGTAIGISLVPPLCTVGFGVGTGSAAIAEGALLLFVANFTAILACATLFFWLVGSHPLPSAAFEGRAAAHYGFGRMLTRVGRRLDQGIASRFHLLWRLVVPVALVLAVSVPLERAYSQMSWQVRTRATLARLVRDTPLLASAVSISSVVESYRVAIRAVVVGAAPEAAAVEAAIRARIETEAGVSPLVTVTAVPRASADATPASLQAPAEPVAAAPSPDVAARVLEDSVAATLHSLWPTAAGRLLPHALTLMQDRAEVRVAALGPGLEPTATEMLERAIGSVVKRGTRVTSVAVPDTELRQPAGRGAVWLSEAGPRVSRARDASTLFACVEVPTRRVSRDAPVRAAVEGWTAELGADRVAVVSGTAWSMRLSVEPCSR